MNFNYLKTLQMVYLSGKSQLMTDFIPSNNKSMKITDIIKNRIISISFLNIRQL